MFFKFFLKERINKAYMFNGTLMPQCNWFR